MHQKPQRTKELARRTFVYALMTLSMITLLLVLTFTMLGYRFDVKTQTLSQTGLVQFNSYPRGAMVSIDGQTLDRTQTKGTVLPGQRQFSMKLDGYEQWQKTIDITSDTVTQLNYARMVPKERRVVPRTSYTGLQDLSFSPEGRYMVAFSVNAENVPFIHWGDISDSSNPKFTDSPIGLKNLDQYADVETKIERRFKVGSWSESERYALIRYQSVAASQPEQTRWLRFDRENPNEFIDITMTIGLSASDIQFDASDGNELFVLQNTGDLRHVNVSGATISGPLVSGVESFSVNSERIVAFTGKAGENAVAGIWRKGWKTPLIFETQPFQPSTQTLQINVSRYFNKDTVTVASGSSVQMYRGTLPETDAALATFLKTSKSFTLGRPISQLAVSRNGRFVNSRGDTGYVSYDIERQSLSQEIMIPKGSELRWIDNYHLWHIDETNQVLMQEFDGVNGYQLMPATRGYDVALAKDQKSIYACKKMDDGTVAIHQLMMTVR